MLTILRYPDERLRTIARPVEHFDRKLHQLIDDMLETMYAAPGIGLAATQIDVHVQLLVIDVSDENNQPLVLINPKILQKDGCQKFDEGCLSVPGIYETVERAQHIRLQSDDKHGQRYDMEAEDLLAVCIQHEMDHLQGKLFVDYLSSLKRQRIRKKLQKQEKQAM